MDLFKALTGKNPVEFELAAHILVDTPDVELFKKLVKQDEFLFDFVKNNVAKRIRNACNKQNYLNLFRFFDYYSPSYDDVISSVLYEYGGEELIPKIIESLQSDNDSAKAYALKFLSKLPNGKIDELLPLIRNLARSEDECLASNAIEVLSTFVLLRFLSII